MKQSIESEKALLGSILMNREAIVAVADSMLPKYFILNTMHRIYTAILTWYQAEISPDTCTVSEELHLYKTE